MKPTASIFRLSFFLCLLSGHLDLQAQLCTNNYLESINFESVPGIWLSSQAEVDALSCDTIDGVLKISGEDIHDLSNLSRLTSITGLIIQDNPLLSSLAGLEQINFSEVPNGDLYLNPDSLRIIWITGNKRLLSMEDMGVVDDRVFELIIENNDSLKSLKGLENIKHTGLLRIIGNASLETAEGLDSLRSCHKVESLFSNFNSPDGIVIGENASLQSLPFPQLQSTDHLFIYSNPSFEQLDGFSSLFHTGRIEILANESLTDISGFDQLTSLFPAHDNYTYPPKALEIMGNGSLQSISGFSSLTTSEGYLNLENNSALTSITGFEQLENLAWLYLRDSPLLIDLSGFRHATAANTIELNNTGIKDFGSFAHLEQISFLYIQNNDSLKVLDEMDYASTYISLLTIEDNPSLDSITETFWPDRPWDTHFSIKISRNQQLKLIDGFLGIQTIRDLFIQDNPSLRRISGFSSLLLVQDSIYLSNNPSLKACYGLFPLLDSGEYSKGFFHMDNTGCSEQDILASVECPPLEEEEEPDMEDTTVIVEPIDSITPPPLPDELSIGTVFPNPSYDIVKIPLELPESLPLRLSFTDPKGRRVLQMYVEELDAGIHEFELDLRSLSPGLYYYHLQVGDIRDQAPVVVLR